MTPRKSKRKGRIKVETASLRGGDTLGQAPRDGQAVADFAPHKNSARAAVNLERPSIDFRARFLQMWGPDAFKSQISVDEQFQDLRRQRES